MPNYVRNSPWTDAANYGGGAGQALGQALFQMPLQRQQLAAQNAQMLQQRQMEMLRYALQQKQQAAEQQLGQSELALKQQEMTHNDEFHKAEVAAAMQRAQNEARGTFKFGETKEGRPYTINTLTGEHKWVTEPDDGMQGKPPLPMTGGQAAVDQLGRIRQYASALGSVGSTDPNRPDISKLDPALLGMLSNRVYNAAAPTLGMRPAIPPMPSVGVPPMLNATNNMAPATTPRVFKYNPATGQLE